MWMQMKQRPIRALVIVVLVLFSSLVVADHFWRGKLTVYYDDCKQHAALRRHLTASGIPFRIDERNGIVLGAVKKDEIAKRIGLRDLMRIPRQTGHRFHRKLDTHSTANWTVSPAQTGHRFHSKLDSLKRSEQA